MASCMQADFFKGIYWDSLDEEPASRKASDYRGEHEQFLVSRRNKWAALRIAAVHFLVF